MIGLDTNVIVRYLTQDDPAQSQIANTVINKAIDQGELLWISLLTLAETTWVLERAYKIPKNKMVEVLHTLLQIQELMIEKHDIVWHALHDYKKCKEAGFVDCLIGRQNISNDCLFTYTFDKDAAKEIKTFQLLEK